MNGMYCIRNEQLLKRKQSISIKIKRVNQNPTASNTLRQEDQISVK